MFILEQYCVVLALCSRQPLQVVFIPSPSHFTARTFVLQIRGQTCSVHETLLQLNHLDLASVLVI